MDLKARYGFTTHKLKGGVFPPDYEIEVFRALAKAVGTDSLRYDPNAAFSVEEALRFGRRIEDLNNDYYEDPDLGLERDASRARGRSHSARHQHRGH